MMRLGVSIFPTDQTLPPGEVARAAEDLGFESLWFPEHSHIPSSRATPWGGRPGAPPLPEYYARTHEQFVALTAAAAASSALLVGSGVSLVAQRDPIWLAKQVASVDWLASGRLLFGIGYGWNREEMAQHGVRCGERRELLREKVLLMKELWTKEEAAFHGELLELEPTWSWPKPHRAPHPPIIMGASAGPRTFSDIVEFCDGWMPIYRPELLTEQIGALHRTAASKGRDPASIEIGVFAAPRDPQVLADLADAGVTRAVFTLPPVDPSVVLAKLEKYSALLG